MKIVKIDEYDYTIKKFNKGLKQGELESSIVENYTIKKFNKGLKPIAFMKSCCSDYTIKKFNKGLKLLFVQGRM